MPNEITPDSEAALLRYGIQFLASGAPDVQQLRLPRFNEEHAIYCLPCDVVHGLARPRRSDFCLFDSSQVEREIEFTKKCEQHFAIGVFHGRLITGTPLNRRPAAPGRDRFETG